LNPGDKKICYVLESRKHGQKSLTEASTEGLEDHPTFRVWFTASFLDFLVALLVLETVLLSSFFIDGCSVLSYSVLP